MKGNHQYSLRETKFTLSKIKLMQPATKSPAKLPGQANFASCGLQKSVFNKCWPISKSLAGAWSESMAGFERLRELTDLLVMDDSEKPLKGQSEKIGLCNYRDLCLLQLQKFHCILEISAQESEKREM